MELSPEEINDIITKYLLGNINDNEQATLDKWLENPFNQLQFDKLTATESFLQTLEHYQKFNADKAWNKIRGGGFKPHQWIKYVASIIVVLGVGSYLLYEFNRGAELKRSFTQVEVLRTDDVILKTDKGVYAISKKDTIINLDAISAQANEDQLLYDKGSSNKKKLVYNTITTPKNRRFFVQLSDDTKVWLNSGTTLKYPVNFIGDNRVVSLVNGEAYFEVAEDKKKPFYVAFNQTQVQVLGTAFNIKAQKDLKCNYITLLEGSISLKDNFNDIEMVPNQQAMIKKSDGNLTLKRVEGNKYIAWKNDTYLYVDVELDIILKDLQRDFDINVFYQNQTLKHQKFSLKIHRHRSINKICEALAKAGDFTININENTLIIK